MRALAIAIVLAACGGANTRPETVVVPAQPSPSPPSAPVATAPPAAAPPPRSVVRIALLSNSEPSCGLDAAGQEWTWRAGHFEKGDGLVPNARSYTCDLSHACAVTTDGKALCWGQNSYGKLGDGTEESRTQATPVKGLADVAEIDADGERTCARTNAGAVYCWGDSEFGKAGDGRLPDNVGREKLLAGTPVLTGATGLAVGSAHAFAILPGGKLSCWGQNNGASCGFPAARRYLPRPALVPKSSGIASVGAGSSITCTVDTKGVVACFGQKFGDPYTSTDKPVPVPLPEPAAEVAVGWAHHACARLVSGAVRCWGENDEGELGDGTTTARAQSVEVSGLGAQGKAIRIAADGERSCALLEDGRVFCWGKDLVDEGGGDVRLSLVPVEVR